MISPQPGERYRIHHVSPPEEMQIKALIDYDHIAYQDEQGYYHVVNASYFNAANAAGYLEKLPGFSDAEYLAFEKHTDHQEDKRRDLIKYNEANGTDYRFFFEYVHKRRRDGITCEKIGKPFGLTENAVRAQLRKMGMDHLNAACKKLTPEDVAAIILSRGSASTLAKRHNVVPCTIYDIREGRTWQKDEEVKRLVKEGRAAQS